MFGQKKKSDKKPAEKISAQVTAIPKEFYGGANPVVYQQQTPTKKKEKKKLEKSVAPHDPEKRHTAMSVDDARKAINAATGNVEKTKTLPGKAPKMAKTSSPRPHTSSKKPFIIIGVAVLLLALAGGSWYIVVRDTSGPVQVAAPQPPAPPPPPLPPPPPPPVVATTTEPVDPEPTVPTTTPSLQQTPLSFPRVLLADSSDLDADSLTDEEEALFGSDVGIWDSDEDGYYDGQELFNLYNPSGFAPVRLIDSGFVRDYVHAQWQYRVYYPISWDIASVDEEERQVLFSAITGDFIEVRVMDRRFGESFEEWFGREATDQLYTDLQPIENRFQEQGMRRSDDLVAYFTTDEHIFIIIYNPGVTGAIPYRHVMQMMYQSFRPGRNIVPLPPQRTIPPLPTGPPTSTVSTDVASTTIDDAESVSTTSRTTNSSGRRIIIDR